MGKRKIELKKLEPVSHRNSTFGQRFEGLQKKAEEFSGQFHIPVVLVVSKPTGMQQLCLTGDRTFEQIVEQFASLSKESRDIEEKHCIEILERAYKDDDHVVDVKSLMHNGVYQAEGDETFEKKKELEEIEEKIAKLEDGLGPLQYANQLEKINSIDELAAIEVLLEKIFSLNEAKEAILLEQQRNNHHHLLMPNEGDLPVSTSPLSQQIDGGLSEALLLEQQKCDYHHLPAPIEGDDVTGLPCLCDSIEEVDPEQLFPNC